jgi:hypothetical protein
MYDVWKSQAREFAERAAKGIRESQPDTVPVTGETRLGDLPIGPSAAFNYGTFQLYVGADNTTDVLDRPTLFRVLDERHEGYTVTFATGAWEGKHQESAVVTLSDTESRVRATAASLRYSLDQDSVGMVRIGGSMEFVDIDE